MAELEEKLQWEAYNMRECPFCGFVEGNVVESPWNIIESRKDHFYVVQCGVCSAVGPESKTPEGAEKKWEGYLSEISTEDKEEFQNALDEGFKRGIKSPRDLNIGIAQSIADKTSNAYSYDLYYNYDNWLEITKWLLDQGYTPIETEQVLRSKIMRWTAHESPYTGKNSSARQTNLDDFLYFNNKLHKGLTQTDWFIKTEGPFNSLDEDAIGGVSAPMSTLSNTPGMGNAVPGSAATGNIGSGDKWGGSLPKKKRKKKLEEDNINPYDQVGTAMAKKMGVPITFKKSKNQGVKQKKIGESRIITLDEFSKKLEGGR